MNKFSLSIFLIFISFAARSQYLGMGERMDSLIYYQSKDGYRLGFDYFTSKGVYIAAVSHLDTATGNLYSYLYGSASLLTHCFEINISIYSQSSLNAAVKFFNKDCAVVDSKHWRKYLGQLVFNIKLVTIDEKTSMFIITKESD